MPLFNWLTQKDLNDAVNNTVSGDFTKYLIDTSGKLVGIFNPEIDPLNNILQDAIKGIE